MGLGKHVRPMRHAAVSLTLMLAMACGAPSVLAHGGHAHSPADRSLERLFGSRGAAALPADSPARIPTARELADNPALRSTLPSDSLVCSDVVEVPGQGPSCRIKDGLWRINLDDGTSVVSHGPDSAPTLPIAVNNTGDGTTSDIQCVAADSHTPHYQLIYAYPPDVATREGTIVPELRQAAYDASYHINQRSQDQGGGTRKLRLACSGGVPTVAVHELQTSSGGDSFSSVASDLRALGYTREHGARNYIVYYDGVEAGSGAAGQGDFLSDSNSGYTNANRQGGSFAIDYNYGAGGTHPLWTVILHETGHNMGAVQNDAPHGSGAAHCGDDQDIMCYNNDGGSYPSGFSSNTCVSAPEVWDCNGDDYFNAGAPAGYLATHWNLASQPNWFLEGSWGSDLNPPSKPNNIRATTVTTNSVTWEWDPASDDSGVDHYRVEYWNGAWVSTTTAATSFTDPTSSTTRYIKVWAVDAQNNESLQAPNTGGFVSIDEATAGTRPRQAPNPRLTHATSTTMVLAWDAAPDTEDGTAASYAVERYDFGGPGWTAQGTTASRRFTLTGLAADDYVLARVRPVDSDGNSGPWSQAGEFSGNAALTEATPPQRVSGLSATGHTGSSISLEWDAGDDNIGVTQYRLQQSDDGGASWTTIANINAPNVTTTVGSLAGNATYHFRIRSRDAAGNVSLYSAAVSETTGDPDIIAPDQVTGLATGATTDHSIVLSWNAGTDNVAVTGYDVQRSTDGGINWSTIASTDLTTFTASNLSPSTQYTFQVRAYDAQDNAGAYSSSVSEYTAADSTNPSVVDGITVALVAGQYRLNWNAATDNAGVSSYTAEIHDWNYALVTSQSGPATQQSFALTAGLYRARVIAYDAVGNYSVSGYVSFSVPDTAAPSAPTKPSLVRRTRSSLSFAWTRPSDNVGVVRYTIQQRTGTSWTSVGTSTGVAFRRVNLRPGRRYYFRVVAHDAAGNHSAASATAAFVTRV